VTPSPAASRVESAAEVGALFLRVGKLTRRRLHEQLAEHGVTVQQGHALHALAAGGGWRRLHELGEDCGMLASTVTGVVDRLEQAGLAVRERDHDDRRVVWVRLTDHGRARVAELPGWRDELARAFTVLPAGELAQLRASVERVLAELEKGEDA
jgi:MarR family transcriptional regulator, organic hydroperoxide resistance regulator